MKALPMKFLRHSLIHRQKIPVVTLVVVSTIMVGGCALNPFRDKSANADPVAADAADSANKTGVVQTVQKKKLFGVLPVYRPDVQQGNFVSKEMVAQLKVGMTPEQVRFVLGSPLVTDVFHSERWDYPFRMRKGDGQITTSHVSVFFKEGRVERFEGGDLPEEKDYLQRLAKPQK